MFRITWIPNMEKFLKVVERSRGDVRVHLPGGVVCSLKQDPVAMALLRTVRSGDGFSVSLTDRSDFPAFLQYLLEAGHRPSLAEA